MVGRNEETLPYLVLSRRSTLSSQAIAAYEHPGTVVHGRVSKTAHTRLTEQYYHNRYRDPRASVPFSHSLKIYNWLVLHSLLVPMGVEVWAAAGLAALRVR